MDNYLEKFNKISRVDVLKSWTSAKGRMRLQKRSLAGQKAVRDSTKKHSFHYAFFSCAQYFCFLFAFLGTLCVQIKRPTAKDRL